MDRTDVEIVSLRDGDWETIWDLGRQAFGETTPFDPELPAVEADRVVAAYDHDRVMGTVKTIGFEMFWNGGSIACGGVSGVVVRPEDRGRGLAKSMLRESFDRMAARGEVLAALYPTTATLYRSVGFEICGSFHWRKVGLDLIPTGPASSLSWRRVEFADPAVRSVYEAMAPGLDGWFLPGDVWWRRTIRVCETEKGKNQYAYVGSRDGVDVAAVNYRYAASKDRLYELGVDLIAGVDGDALAGALAFLASNGTTAGHLETTLPGDLLSLHVPNMQHTSVTSDWPWMLRLVDVAGAFATRRWPSSVSGRIEVDVVDDIIPANAGPHVIAFSDGAAVVSPGGAGKVRVDVTDLAAIYAGGDVGLRHRSGRLEGATQPDVDLLAAACASNPSMPFFF